jgi:ribose transport system permease protein
MEQPEFILVIVLILMCIILNFVNKGFFTTANFKPMSRGITIEGFTLIGMTFLLIAGVFDISVGSVMALSGFVFTALAAAHVNVYVAILAALAVGALVGLLNGFVITKLEVNPFIATLATMTIVRGLVLALSQGRPVRVSTPEFNQFSTSETFGIPSMFIFFLVVLICVDFFLRHIRYFRQFYFIGGNENSAELTGINVKRVRLILFVVISVLAALSGVLASSRLEAAVPNAFFGVEMKLIVACVIGGCSLNGGSGSILGSVLGLVFLFLLDNGLVMLGVDIYWFTGILGVFLIGVVLLNTFSSSSIERKQKKTEKSLHV